MAEQPLSPEEGFASILERYEKMVYGFALARTGSRADADDVFQKVFLAYFQCGKHFREEEHRRAWLLRNTLNFSRRVTASPWRSARMRRCSSRPRNRPGSGPPSPLCQTG